MAGHWRRRGNSIELRTYAGRDPLTGARRYATRTIPLVGKREADKELAAFVAALASGKASDAGAGRTFGELLEQWFTTRSHDWSPGTAYQTRWIIDHRLAGLRDRPLKALDAAVLDEFYVALRERGGAGGKPLSVASVRRVHGVVRLALEQAVKWGWRADNPAAKADPGKPQTKRISPPSRAEIGRLLRAAETADPELLTFLFLDAETGARRGEVAALRLSDFTRTEVRISRSLSVGLMTEHASRTHAGRIWPAGWGRGRRPTALIEKDKPKNDSSIRTVALSPVTMQLVQAQVARLAERARAAGLDYPHHGFLFPASLDGSRPWRPERWTRQFRHLCDELGINSRLHDVATSWLRPRSRRASILRLWPAVSATAEAARPRSPSTPTSFGSPIALPPR
jgi:integrase